ncbi:MAG: hypothetical protein ACRCZO_16895, partial [Cetobacterium sp.]
REECGGCFFKWKYRHYFDLIGRKNKNIIVKCNLCAISNELSTAINSTSNLLKHLQRKHSTTKFVAKDTRAQDESGPTLPKHKQARLDFYSGSGGITQQTFGRLLTV